MTRNGNNLKLKVKSDFSLSMGLMVINHSNPYSTTILCDNIIYVVIIDALYSNNTTYCHMFVCITEILGGGLTPSTEILEGNCPLCATTSVYI